MTAGYPVRGGLPAGGAGAPGCAVHCGHLVLAPSRQAEQAGSVVQVERQQDTLYGVDFQLVVLERRVARAHGVVSREEADRLAARIAELGMLLSAAQAEQSLLLAQSRRVEDDCSARPAPSSLQGFLMGPGKKVWGSRAGLGLS